MSDSYWNILKSEIHDKCVFYEYIDQSDMSLAEFIINIIQMGKSPEEISTELSSLIGDDYDQNMTQWIFLRLEELKNPQTIMENNHSYNNNNDHHSNNGHHHYQDEKEKQFTATTTKKETRQSVSTGRSRIFAQALDGLKPKQSRHDHNEGRERSYSRHSNNHNHRYSSRSRSRSRSPERNRDRTSYRNRKDVDDNNNINSRLGKKVHSSSVFDRLGIQKPETVVDERSKQRCKYWPECDKGEDCIYVHPTILCSEFPNCPKPTNECLFIHPEIRPKKNTSKHTPTNPNLTQKAIPCRFFPYCTNDQCPFFHPPLPSYPMPVMNITPPTVKKIPVQCKNGDKCDRPDCHFLHPNDTNPSETICKFDGACTRPNCFYKHTIQSTTFPIGHTVNKTLIIHSNPSEPKKHKNERLFAVAEDDQVEKMVLGESADIIKM